MSDKITSREFKEELRSALRKRKIFSDPDLDEIEKVFQGDLREGNNAGYGISRDEMKERFRWLRSNKSKHKLDREELDILEEEMGRLF